MFTTPYEYLSSSPPLERVDERENEERGATRRGEGRLSSSFFRQSFPSASKLEATNDLSENLRRPEWIFSSLDQVTPKERGRRLNRLQLLLLLSPSPPFLPFFSALSPLTSLRPSLSLSLSHHGLHLPSSLRRSRFPRFRSAANDPPSSSTSPVFCLPSFPRS